MTGFLGRLAHRAILPPVKTAVADAPIKPRLPGRFEVAPFAGGEVPNDTLTEEHSYVTAEPAAPTSEPRAIPSVTRDKVRDAPFTAPNLVEVDEVRQPRESNEERPSSARHFESIERQDDTTVSSDSIPIDPQIPAPVSSPSQSRDAEPEAFPGPESRVVTLQPETPLQTSPSPRLELVIDRQRVAPLEIERESLLAAPVTSAETLQSTPSRQSVSPPTEAKRRRNTAAPELQFETREPLEPLNIRPLQIEEILADPLVADALSEDSVVHVHIGRVDVQRPPPPAAPIVSKPNRDSGMLSLDDYFVQRAASRRGPGR